MPNPRLEQLHDRARRANLGSYMDVLACTRDLSLSDLIQWEREMESTARLLGATDAARYHNALKLFLHDLAWRRGQRRAADVAKLLGEPVFGL